MCGRYRRTTKEEELARLYHIPIPKQTDLPISYNIAPSQQVLTIRFNPETQARSLDALQWGLIPYWAKDPKIAYQTINARAETVDKAPSFRQAFIKRRCLIPADGFYEWRKTAKPKLPFAIAMKDGRPFTFAGLCLVYPVIDQSRGHCCRRRRPCACCSALKFGKDGNASRHRGPESASKFRLRISGNFIQKVNKTLSIKGVQFW
jgi:putative SOS response-associated peptidase YedK